MHPEQYKSSDFGWDNRGGEHEDALAFAMDAYRRGIGEKPVTKEAWLSIVINNKLRELSSTPNVPVYHPEDRANESQEAISHELETKILGELLAVGHSLVVVEAVSQDLHSFTNTEPAAPSEVPKAPEVRARWGRGVGDHAEFLPPMYMGRHLRKWYALVRKNPEDYKR